VSSKIAKAKTIEKGGQIVLPAYVEEIGRAEAILILVVFFFNFFAFFFIEKTAFLCENVVFMATNTPINFVFLCKKDF